ASDPEAALGHAQTGAAIRRGLAALSREHAEIIDLVYYQAKSIREIAEILAIPENTVKTRMFYARKRLAAAIVAAREACAPRRELAASRPEFMLRGPVRACGRARA